MFRNAWNKAKSYLPRANEVQAERARRFEERTDVIPDLAPELVGAPIAPLTYPTTYPDYPECVSYQPTAIAQGRAAGRSGTMLTNVSDYYRSNTSLDDIGMRTVTRSLEDIQRMYGTGSNIDEALTSDHVEQAYQRAIAMGAGTYTALSSGFYTTNTTFFHGDTDSGIWPIKIPSKFKITVNTRRKWD